jgi:hypothetical protein
MMMFLSGGLLALVMAQVAPPAVDGAPPPARESVRARKADRNDRPDPRVDAPASELTAAPVVLRALWAADPPVDALRAAATALALAEPARARSLVERSRLAGWLPEVRGRVDRRFARSESVDLGSSATALAPVGLDSNNDVRYELRATWDLSRAVFNPDEIAAEAQALRIADARREIESLVIRLYFERRRLKAESLTADISLGMRLELRTAEVEAELDAVTGGAFTRLARRRAGDDPSAGTGGGAAGP